jgi:perosamine synthetase
MDALHLECDARYVAPLGLAQGLGEALGEPQQRGLQLLRVGRHAARDYNAAERSSPRAQYVKVPQMVPWIGEEEYLALRDCFARAWITEGPQALEFHDRLLELIGSRHGVFAPNGTLALYLALRALEIGPGDEVIVPDLTFVASANAVEMTGATPVFADVAAGHFQLTAESIEPWITPRTRAVMPVHLWGSVAEIEPILALAQRRGLAVVEDAAQAVGVRRHGRHAGSFGTIGAFSFFADKSLTTAEGGFVVTDDATLHDRLEHLRNQGRSRSGSFVHPRIGYNLRITDLQAAVGMAQLAKLPQVERRKRAHLEHYRERLTGVSELRWFAPPAGSEWIPFRAPLLCERAPDLMRHLLEREIEPRAWFRPLHLQPCYAERVREQLGGARGEDVFPQAHLTHDRGVLLPVFPTLSPTQIDHVCRTIRDFYGHP